MYESWFRFRRRPFTAAPKFDDYFPSEASEHARKTVISCVQRSAGPAVLIGGPGSGKTTTCHQYLGHFRTRTSVALIACAGISSRKTFFQNILFELGRPYREFDEGELRLSLIDFLTNSDISHDGTVLVFDDAHELLEEQFEDLSMLSGLMRDNNHCVQLILSGTVRLEERLGAAKLEAFHQRVAARCYLEPFRIHETEAYIRRQFERADSIADEVFIDGALGAIHKCTGGTPRLINQLCDHALVLAAAGGHTQLDEHGIHEAWSDLQHLPPPEINTPTRGIEDVVEFGDLDDESPFSEAPAGEAKDRQAHADEAPADDDRLETFAADPSISNEPSSTDQASIDQSKTDQANTEHSNTDEFESETESHPDFDGAAVGGVDGDAVPNASVSHDPERQLDEIFDHLDDYQSLPYPLVDVGEDPFSEVFANEELVIRGHGSMLNRLADRQPEVISDYGQNLIATLEQLTGDTAHCVSGNPISSIWGRATDLEKPPLTVHSESAGLATHEPDASDPSDDGTDMDLDWSPPRETQQELGTSEFDGDSSSWPPPQPEGLGHADEFRDRVVDHQESGSYEISVVAGSSVVEGDAQPAFTAGVKAAHLDTCQTKLDDHDPRADAVTSEPTAQEAADSEAANRLSDQDVVTLTIGQPKIESGTDVTAIESAELAPREPGEPAPTIVRVVEVNNSDNDASQPRRRFKQLFSDLTERLTVL